MATQNASSTSGSVIITEVPTGNNTGNNGENTVRIKLKNPNKIKNVKWTEGTVDNEFLNKKSSKKCCIYSKPRRWDESDSESSGSEDEDDKKGHNHQHHNCNHNH